MPCILKKVTSGNQTGYRKCKKSLFYFTVHLTGSSSDGHGFGLYNILRMTERYHGKILTRNESILNENYVVFGVHMP